MKLRWYVKKTIIPGGFFLPDEVYTDHILQQYNKKTQVWEDIPMYNPEEQQPTPSPLPNPNR